MAYVRLDYTTYIYIYIYIFRCLSFLLRKKPLVRENVNFMPLEARLHRACAELFDDVPYKLEEVLKGPVTLGSTQPLIETSTRNISWGEKSASA